MERLPERQIFDLLRASALARGNVAMSRVHGVLAVPKARTDMWRPPTESDDRIGAGNGADALGTLSVIS